MTRAQPFTKRPLIFALLSFALLIESPAFSVASPSLPADTQADYQLGGAYPLADGVGIVSRDRRDHPVPGVYSICYINAFQSQPGARRWWLTHHRKLVLRSHGKPIVDADWGEMLLDTSTRAKRRALRYIVGRWIEGCAASGFQAVEPDNLDSWQRSKGLLKRRDNVAFARQLIQHAHNAGLAIAQKNAAGLAPRRLFDFAIVEQCQEYRECGRFTHAYGNRVIEIEYRRKDFVAACAARADQLPIVLRDVELKPAGERGHRFATC